jgi:hypothetical protein
VNERKEKKLPQQLWMTWPRVEQEFLVTTYLTNTTCGQMHPACYRSVSFNLFLVESVKYALLWPLKYYLIVSSKPLDTAMPRQSEMRWCWK